MHANASIFLYFNPRHPCGWRPTARPPASALVIFQSTPPMRVATVVLTASSNFALFQSTPPMRVATGFNTQKEYEIRISIHATHAGGDANPACGGAGRIHFNPRHPCGWRLFAVRDSCICHHFNPRHPCGWRPCSVPVLHRYPDFNPRHPCGWRHDLTAYQCDEIIFQSTPPMRVATWSASDRLRISYFNPRHPCGWRQERSPM